MRSYTENDSKVGFLAGVKVADKSLEQGVDSIEEIQSSPCSNDLSSFDSAKKPTFESFSIYLALTKPGILTGNAITMTAGFGLASREVFDFPLFGATLLGLLLIMGASCVFNNCIDREADSKMKRTQNRPLAKGEIGLHKALLFGSFLALLGGSILFYGTQALTTAIAFLGAVIYVCLYSFLKYYSRHGILVGSLAGAVPPVVGFTAVTGEVTGGAALLFGMMALWQMPHSYAIAIFRQNDYAAANIPVFPLAKGMEETKRQMFFYTAGFLVVSTLFFPLGYRGYGYLALALALGSFWLFLAWQGLRTQDDLGWARKMFRFSLLVVMILSCALFW